MSRSQRRQLVKKSQRYTLLDPTYIPMLQYRENNGSKSICLVEDEITRFLSAAHEDHGHFAAQLCLGFVVGRVYWPNRVKGVYAKDGRTSAYRTSHHFPMDPRSYRVHRKCESRYQLEKELKKAEN